MEADIEMRALGMRRRENLTERPPQSAYSKAWRQNTIYNAFGEVLASQYGARKGGYWYSIRFPLSAKQDLVAPIDWQAEIKESSFQFQSLRAFDDPSDMDLPETTPILKTITSRGV